MAIITSSQSSITLSLPTSDSKKFITGQTQNTTDFTAIYPAGSYNGKHDVATSRDVDGSTTGANWSNYYFKSFDQRDDYNMSGGITIEDLLPHNKEMEISGYFFRGQTALEADLGGGSFEANTAADFSFDIVYESDSTQFSNFTNNGGKTRLDYASPYDGSVHSSSEYSKWSYHLGKGVLPTYNGSNVGVKGGWVYSSGRSDSNFSQAVHSDGSTLQRDGRLYSVNLDTIGSGLTRFYKLNIVNKSGSSVKLKLLFRNNGTDDKYFGVYDLRTRIYDGGHDRTHSGIQRTDGSGGYKEWFATSKAGLVGPLMNGNTYFYNLKNNTTEDLDHVTESAFVTQPEDSSSYKIEYPINYENATATGQYAIPISSLEDYHQSVTSLGGVKIGGVPDDWDNAGAGAYVLGPMPTSGKIKHFRIKHSTLVAYNSTTLNVLRVDFGSISVGESWTGGAGVQTLLSSESPSAPTSGNHRYRNWDNLDTTFNVGDCLIITLNIGAAHGNIVGSLVIEYDFSSYD